jgi:prepilin-type N-terminal cleavage/methylation domain-containing protein
MIFNPDNPRAAKPESRSCVGSARALACSGWRLANHNPLRKLLPSSSEAGRGTSTGGGAGWLHAGARALPGLNLNSHTRSKRTRSGFTLAEVLAALLLLAIVIPVALEGLHVASRAGEVGQRKMVATRIGNKVLNELKVTGQLQNTGQTGVVQDHGINYRWNVKNQSWTEDALSQMILATLTVSFSVQGQNYDVHLSTLVAPPQQLSSSITSGNIY